jgi:hypothetical protein
VIRELSFKASARSVLPVSRVPSRINFGQSFITGILELYQPHLFRSIIPKHEPDRPGWVIRGERCACSRHISPISRIGPIRCASPCAACSQRYHLSPVTFHFSPRSALTAKRQPHDHGSSVSWCGPNVELSAEVFGSIAHAGDTQSVFVLQANPVNTGAIISDL